MTGAPDRHTKSEGLKRLLRRRGRRHKVGANTGETVYSWAEYGQVNFTSSGDHSRTSAIIGTLAVIGAFLIVPLIFALAGSTAENGLLPLLRILLETFLATLFLLALCLPLIIPVGLFAWIYARLDGDTKKDRERLIAAADTLRAKQAEAQDEGANHAK
jgi:Na+/phosphate symporter